jgi:hypothetical protein
MGAATIAAIALLAGPTTAVADHEGSQHYSRSSKSCTVGDTSNIVDPIGIVFYGAGAYAGAPGHSARTDDLIEGMVDPEHDWVNISASVQWVGSGSQCTETEEQAGTPYKDYGDGYPNPARYHIRLNQNAATVGGLFRTVGTPHYEVDTDECGDVVPAEVPKNEPTASGFDWARGHVKNDWVSAYGSSKVGDVQNWKNTRRVTQCTGSMANSSGRVYFLLTD